MKGFNISRSIAATVSCFMLMCPSAFARWNRHIYANQATTQALIYEIDVIQNDKTGALLGSFSIFHMDRNGTKGDLVWKSPRLAFEVDEDGKGTEVEYKNPQGQALFKFIPAFGIHSDGSTQGIVKSAWVVKESAKIGFPERMRTQPKASCSDLLAGQKD